MPKNLTNNIMSTLSENFVKSFMAAIEAKNPGEPEFHQAVRVVATSLADYIVDRPYLVDQKILERIAEPERVVNTPISSASKTMIFDDSAPGVGGGEVRSSRKLVGWLVSYTLNDMGVDFKLFEGRNTIGRDLDCQISVNDNTVSGKHAVLLYREGSYFIQDSLSTSGTRVNGSDTGVNAVALNDGDVIQVGKTVFKFRTSF